MTDNEEFLLALRVSYRHECRYFFIRTTNELRVRQFIDVSYLQIWVESKEELWLNFKRHVPLQETWSSLPRVARAYFLPTLIACFENLKIWKCPHRFHFNWRKFTIIAAFSGGDRLQHIKKDLRFPLFPFFLSDETTPQLLPSDLTHIAIFRMM